MKILVVCSANIARSQAIAHYLEKYSTKQGLTLEIKSAGTNRELINKLIEKKANSFPLTDKILSAADKLNEKTTTRTTGYAKPLTKELTEWADKIIAVDENTRLAIQTMFPTNPKKVVLAKEMAAGKKLPLTANFKDPYASSKPKRYRRSSKQSTLKNPQPKAFWLMAKEAQHISKGIIRRLK
ncbi:MAG: hypothetical protein WC821_04370 [archaeon]